MAFVDPFARLKGIPALLEKILGCLDDKSICKLHQVCQAWNKWINDSPIWKEKLNNKVSSDVKWKKIAQQLSEKENFGCLEKERYGAIFLATQRLDHNWRNGLAQIRTISSSLGDHDVDLMTMDSKSIVLGLYSGVIKVYNRKDLSQEKDLFHAPHLKFVQLEGDYLISSNGSSIKVWHKDTKELLETVEVVKGESKVAFGIGHGLLVQWNSSRIIGNSVKYFLPRLNVWRVNPSAPSNDRILDLIYQTALPTTRYRPVQSFVTERFIVTIHKQRTDEKQMFEVRSVRDFSDIYSYSEKCDYFVNNNLVFVVNDKVGIQLLKPLDDQPFQIRFIDCAQRSFRDLVVKPILKFCVSWNSKFALFCNFEADETWEIVDMQSAIVSAAQGNSDSVEFIPISLLPSMQKIDGNFIMDEFSILPMPPGPLLQRQMPAGPLD